MLLWKRTTTLVGTLITFIITNSNFNYVAGKEADGDDVDESVHFVDYPIQRFTEWDSIQDAFYKFNATYLGWTKETWNVPESYEDLEYLSFGSLHPIEKQIVRGMKLDEEVWDCYINHYYEYDWYELVEWDIVKDYEGLGWTEDMWECSDGVVDGGEGVDCDVPESEDLDWEELSPKEQQHASNLCFFEELWNGNTLPW